MSQSQKTGPELAEQRVKQKQRQYRRELERLKTTNLENKTARVDSTLIGELKAAQSNNRNEKLKEKEIYFYESIGLRSHRVGAHRDYGIAAQRPFGASTRGIIARSNRGGQGARAAEARVVEHVESGGAVSSSSNHGR